LPQRRQQRHVASEDGGRGRHAGIGVEIAQGQWLDIGARADGAFKDVGVKAAHLSAVAAGALGKRDYGGSLPEGVHGAVDHGMGRPCRGAVDKDGLAGLCHGANQWPAPDLGLGNEDAGHQ